MRRASLGLALALSILPVARAGVIVDTSLSLTSLTIDPDLGTDSGYVQIQTYADNGSGVSASVNATTADNLGDPVNPPYSASNASVDGPTSTTFSIPYATASASGDGSLLTATSSNSITLPSIDAAVLPGSTDANSQIEGFFEIVDTTNPSATTSVNVDFDAVLGGYQNLITDPLGISADSEVTFLFEQPDSGVSLFYDNPLSIGSDTTLLAPVSQTLTGSGSLLTNTPYFFFIETDAESDGSDSAPAVPEPASLLLVTSGLVALAGRRIRRC